MKQIQLLNPFPATMKTFALVLLVLAAFASVACANDNPAAPVHAATEGEKTEKGDKKPGNDWPMGANVTPGSAGGKDGKLNSVSWRYATFLQTASMSGESFRGVVSPSCPGSTTVSSCFCLSSNVAVVVNEFFPIRTFPLGNSNLPASAKQCQCYVRNVRTNTQASTIGAGAVCG